MLSKVQKDWATIAGNPNLKVEDIKGTYYAYGTELECLRLAYQYRYNGDKIKAALVNLNTWFFRLEPTINVSKAEIDALLKP